MLNWNQIALNDDNSGGYLLSQVFLEPDKQRRDVEKRIKKRIINGLKELCHPQWSFWIEFMFYDAIESSMSKE